MNLKLGEITNADVQDYLASLVDFGYSYSTIKKQLEIIFAPIRNAYEQRMIPFNPCLPVKLPHKANVKKQQKGNRGIHTGRASCAISGVYQSQS